MEKELDVYINEIGVYHSLTMETPSALLSISQLHLS